MNPVVRRLWLSARRRRAAIAVLRGLPWLVAAALLAWPHGPALLAVSMLGGMVLIAASAASAMRRIDQQWLVRRLDRQVHALQDSSDLLFAAPDALNPVERLQQARATRALADAVIDLREPWPRSSFARQGIAALALGLAAWLWLAVVDRDVPNTQPSSTTTSRTVTPTVAASLEIEPPAYTGLPTRRGTTLDARVEEGAMLRWELRVEPVPTAVRLRFVEGAALELQVREGAWQGVRQIERGTLYRIEADGVELPAAAVPHRLEVIPDRAPQLTVSAPERTLTVLDAAQRRWPLAFTAQDDYGLGEAELDLTLAQGSGEQVTVSERRLALRGEGDDRSRRYAHAIDLAALGFAPGDDLIARLQVRDRRQPQPNVSRSSSFILRWPAEAGDEGSGVEGLVQTTMPAYFRSQRQIIIDTEALLAQRATLSRDELVARSDAIGADQRLLRLRYGQFLGEEASEVEAPGEDAHDAAGEHGPGTPPVASADALIAEAGHLHDIAEAATLLDPETRKLLRAALSEMWQAEGALRTGAPATALPFEYRALDLIKRVQQSNRIYLARVGLELPALDPERRLTGEKPAPGSRVDPLAAPTEAPDPARSLWHALRDGQDLPLDAFAQWVAASEALTDPLGLLVEVDALRRSPDCRACRQRLAQALWPLLALPAAAPPARVVPDVAGRAYLDALAPVAGSE
jgi:hypothetical protein